MFSDLEQILFPGIVSLSKYLGPSAPVASRQGFSADALDAIAITAELAMRSILRGRGVNFFTAELTYARDELSIDSLTAKRILLTMLILSILSFFRTLSQYRKYAQDSPGSLTGCSGSTRLTRCSLVVDP